MHIAECKEPFWRFKMAAATSTCGSGGNTEEPDKPTEAFQGDAAAEEEPAGGAVSTEQLQHKAVLIGGCL